VRSTPRPKLPPKAPAAPLDASSRVDRDLVASAIRKVAGGQSVQLTRQERSALKRHEKAKEEQHRWQYYASIPQKHWRQMSGRQTKVLHEQASRYGIPFGGPVVNLPAVAKAIHDFLADNAIKLAKEDDPLLQGGASPALERYREERALLARLDRLERENQLLPRSQVREALGRIAVILRGAGDALGRQFGPAATELLHEALDDAAGEIDRSFGNPDCTTAELPPQDDNDDNAPAVSESPGPNSADGTQGTDAQPDPVGTEVVPHPQQAQAPAGNEGIR
jgi:hypothetical protein